jgi:tetratricopeptide (TPR) repeat protein
MTDSGTKRPYAILSILLSVIAAATIAVSTFPGHDAEVPVVPAVAVTRDAKPDLSFVAAKAFAGLDTELVRKRVKAQFPLAEQEEPVDQAAFDQHSKLLATYREIVPLLVERRYDEALARLTALRTVLTDCYANELDAGCRSIQAKKSESRPLSTSFAFFLSEFDGYEEALQLSLEILSQPPTLGDDRKDWAAHKLSYLRRTSCTPAEFRRVSAILESHFLPADIRRGLPAEKDWRDECARSPARRMDPLDAPYRTMPYYGIGVYNGNDTFRLKLLNELRPQLTDPKELIRCYELAAYSLERLGDMNGRDAAEALARNIARRDAKLLPGLLLEQGNRAMTKKSYDRALPLYDRIIAWGDAKNPTVARAAYNSGLALMQLGRYDEAVSYFAVLFPSEIADVLPGRHIMETHQSPRHSAAVLLRECYHRQKNYPQAYLWAVLARDQYRYSSSCGTCSMQVVGNDRRQAALLRMKIDHSDAALDEAFRCYGLGSELGGAIASEFARRRDWRGIEALVTRYRAWLEAWVAQLPSDRRPYSMEYETKQAVDAEAALRDMVENLQWHQAGRLPELWKKLRECRIRPGEAFGLSYVSVNNTEEADRRIRRWRARQVAFALQQDAEQLAAFFNGPHFEKADAADPWHLHLAVRAGLPGALDEWRWWVNPASRSDNPTIKPPAPARSYEEAQQREKDRFTLIPFLPPAEHRRYSQLYEKAWKVDDDVANRWRTFEYGE